MAVLGWLWFAVVSAIIVGVSITDWRRRLVANGAVVALTILALLFVVGGKAETAAVASMWWALVAATAFVAIGVVAYSVGLIAAGDVKLVLPVALIMTRLDTTAWMLYLGVFIVAGFVVLAVFGRARRTMPLAPAIGLGVIPALLAAPPPWFG